MSVQARDYGKVHCLYRVVAETVQDNKICRFPVGFKWVSNLSGHP